MPIPLFNRFGNTNRNTAATNYNAANGNIISQFVQLRKNPGQILDIMLQNEKIDQQQYNELYPFRNNPEMVARYLMNNGKSGEINHAQQVANQINGR